MEYLAKFISTTMVEIIKTPVDPDKLQELLNNNFVEFVSAGLPVVAENQKCDLSYYEQEGKVYQLWTVTSNVEYYNGLIDALKVDLAASDYKVLKCYEASLVGSEPPYDIAELSTQRQSLRDQIGQIEVTIANL